MEFLHSLLIELQHLADTTWFHIGSTPVTPLRIVGLIVILSAVWWLGKFVEKALLRFARGDVGARFSPSAVYALTRLTRYTVWIVGSIIGLNFIGFDLASLALFGGAIGVGIGFGLQNIFSNFISGIILLLEQSLKVGDFVDLQSGVIGRVAEIGMRYTRITTNDSVDVIVPNSEFINGRVTNWTLGDRYRRLHIPFGVAYGSDKEKVLEAAMAAAQVTPGTVEDGNRHSELIFTGFGDSALNFELLVWVTGDKVLQPGRTHSRYLWALDDALRERGIEIPFPQRDLHLRSSAVGLGVREGGAQT